MREQLQDYVRKIRVSNTMILIHPTCYTSYKLVEALHEHKLLDNIELIDVAQKPSIALEYRILSVPAIVVNGKTLYAGPIDLDKALRLIRGEIEAINVHLDVEGLVNKIIEVVADSLALSAITIYNGIEQVLYFKDTIRAGIGLVDDELLEKAFTVIKSNSEYHEKFVEKATRNLAYNTMRILYWSYGKRIKTLRDLREFLSLDHLALIIEALSVNGRIGLVHYRRKKLVERIRPVYEYLTENFARIINDVFKEQDKIIFDDEYIDILRSKGLDTRYLEDLRLLLRT